MTTTLLKKEGIEMDEIVLSPLLALASAVSGMALYLAVESCRSSKTSFHEGG